MSYSLREFRTEDALLLEGSQMPEGWPLMGLTIVMDDKPVGYAGMWCIGGMHWAFMHFRPEIKGVAKVFLARNVLAGLDACAREGIHEIFTVCDTRYPRAAEFMRWLGFVSIPEHEKSESIRAYELAASGALAWVRRR